MTIPRGCNQCGRCDRISAVDELWPSCEDCLEPICPACQAPGSQREVTGDTEGGEDGPAVAYVYESARCLTCVADTQTEAVR